MNESHCVINSTKLLSRKVSIELWLLFVDADFNHFDDVSEEVVLKHDTMLGRKLRVDGGSPEYVVYVSLVAV